MNLSRRSCGKEYLHGRHRRREERQQTGLQHLPAIEGKEEHDTHSHTEHRPQLCQSMYLIRIRTRQALHHPLRKTVVFNLLPGSLLEEVLY
jgi:hypothetical protein